MPKFTSHLYTIEALTNLHPGSGDANYSTVDKTVQRDPATGYPTIHSSSLKGALREYFEQETDMMEATVQYIFGDRPKQSTEESKGKGAYRFFSAQLLSLPLRSNYRPYYHAISNGTVETLDTLCKHLLSSDQYVFQKQLAALLLPENAENAENAEEEEAYCHVLDTLLTETSIEGYKAKEALHLNAIPADLKEWLSGNIAIFQSENLCQITRNQLPVIARNQLENGESKNLWYEEVLPRMTKLYFFVQVPEGQEAHFKTFNEWLDTKTVQIGANASIGYGYCLIKKMV